MCNILEVVYKYNKYSYPVYIIYRVYIEHRTAAIYAYLLLSHIVPE